MSGQSDREGARGPGPGPAYVAYGFGFLHSIITCRSYKLTHWHTQPAVRRAEPSMPLLLILALCQ
jgi:hypothetical protein